MQTYRGCLADAIQLRPYSFALHASTPDIFATFRHPYMARTIAQGGALHYHTAAQEQKSKVSELTLTYIHAISAHLIQSIQSVA